MNRLTRVQTNVRRALSALLAVLMISVGFFILPNSSEAATISASEVDETRLANTPATDSQKPNWKLVKGLTAHWMHPLVKDSLYWTTDRSTGTPPTPPTVGSEQTILNENYSWDTALSSYKIRPVLNFVRNSDATNGTFTNSIQFSSQAIGVYDMDHPVLDPATQDTALTVYFWAYSGTSSGQNFIPTVPIGYTSVVRVTSGDPNIYVGVMPLASTITGEAGWTSTVNNGSNGTGGEVNQATGFLHITSVEGVPMETSAWNSTADNNSYVQFTVWDPVTGNYSRSRLLQPGDWSAGMTSMSADRQKLYLQANGTGYSGAAPIASADMGLDALSNMYLYVAGDEVPAMGSAYSANVVRIVPPEDLSIDPVTGKTVATILDGTKSRPWRYTVITKVKRKIDGQYWGNASLAWGVGIKQGQFFVGPVMASNGAGVPGTSGMPSRLVKVDPLTGYGEVIGTPDSGTNVGPSETYNIQEGWDGNNRYNPATVTARDLASPSGLMSIQGVVYQDVDGKGAGTADSEKPTNAVGLGGQTLALYDSTGSMLGTTTSSAQGTYAFVIPQPGEYYVRVVQPTIQSVPAHQTWARVSSGVDKTGRSSSASAQCLINGTVTAIGKANGSVASVCEGSKKAPYIDSNVEGIGGAAPTVGDWPFYAKVDVRSDLVVAGADFAFSTKGSYGDAPTPPLATETATTVAPGSIPLDKMGPVLQSALAKDLKLGDKTGMGAYDDGKKDDAKADSHDTDDGVKLKMPDGSGSPLQGLALVRGHDYELNVSVKGGLATNSRLSIFQKHSTASLNEAASTVYDQDVTTAGEKTVAMPVTATDKTGLLYMRAMVTSKQPSGCPVGVSEDDRNGFFAKHTKANNDKCYWTVPGEVEDYSYYVVNSLVRLKVELSSAPSNIPADGQPFKYELTNISNTSPSSSTDTIVAKEDDKLLSPTIHELVGASGSVKVTEKPLLPDYQLNGVSCVATQTGTPVAITDTYDRSFTINSVNAGDDVTCTMKYSGKKDFVLPKAGRTANVMGVGIVLLLCSFTGQVVLMGKKRHA